MSEFQIFIIVMIKKIAYEFNYMEKADLHFVEMLSNKAKQKK